MQNNSEIESSKLSAAKNNYARGDYNGALKLLLDSLGTTDDANTYVDIGSCYFMMHNYEQALEYWNRAIDLDPKNSAAFSNMGNLYYKKADMERAISYWLAALISRPEDATTCLNLAIAYDNKNMRFEAIKYFEKYIKYCEDKESTEYKKVKAQIQHCYHVANEYLKLGAGFHAENKDKKAAACYFKSLANYPNLSKTNLNLGSIFFADKNLELAIKYWVAALHIDRRYDKTYSNLAISYDFNRELSYAYCYYHQYMNFVINDKEEYYKAQKRLVKIKPYLNEHPELIQMHLQKAQEYLANNEIDFAIDEFKHYSILNPHEAEEYKELIAKLESYINPELDIIANCFKKGEELISMGRYSEAKNYFIRVMKLSSPQYLEFSRAKAKYSQCESAEMETDI